MKQLSLEISRATLNLIFPIYCQGCGVKLSYDNKKHLCINCLEEIRLNTPPFCIRCGRPLSGDKDIKTLCPECLNKRYNFTAAWQCCEYKGLMKELIHKFKYNKKIFLKNVFADIMCEFAKNYMDYKKIDAVIPVPIDRARLKIRGFNQAALLAVELSRALDMAFFGDYLIKTKKTKQQVDLIRQQRLINIKDAFAVKKEAYLQKKRLLLIDDVLTTAATVNECSKALMAAGTESVWVLALARGI